MIYMKNGDYYERMVLMSRADKIEMEGTVSKAIKGGKFEVKLNDNDKFITCSLSGKLRMNYIKVLPGDIVTVEISPYDLSKGIITWRNK